MVWSCGKQGLDRANEPLRIEAEAGVACQFASQTLNKPGAKAAVLWYGNGRAAVLAPEELQPPLFGCAPGNFDLSRVNFQGTMFERICAKLMERHRPRSHIICWNAYNRPVDHEPVLQPLRTERSKRLV